MRRAFDMPFSLSRHSRKIAASACFAGVLAAISLTGCGKAEAPPPSDAPEVRGQVVQFPATVKALPGIATQPVVRGGERMLSLPGRLVWDEDKTVRVGVPFAGRVTSILVQPGTSVKSGQPLATLMSTDFGVAQADARKAAAEQAVAGKALARQRELYQAGVIAQKDYEQAQADSARASAELQRTQAALRQYGAMGKGGAAGGGDAFSLRSPIDGLVVERNINPGMELRPDQPPTAPLFLITDPTTLWAQVDAAESDLSLFRPGGTVALTTAAYPGETFTGTVLKIADYVDPVSRAIKVRLVVPNADRRLKAEMFVTAKLRAQSFAGMGVPSKAVFLADNRSYAFVRTGQNTFERRSLRLGVSLPGTTEVLEGLKEGENVVTDGNLYLQDILRDATAVNAAKSGQPASQPAGAAKKDNY